MEVSLNIRQNQEFLDQFPVGAFLQSRFWAQVLKLQGIKNWQLNVYNKNRVVAQCLLYGKKLPFGKGYLYAPKGPLIQPDLLPLETQEAFALILTQIRDITIATEKRQEIFCRLEPNIAPSKLEIEYLPTEAIHPNLTSVLDLLQSPDELLKQFKEKTRYNIRLAEKKNLHIFWDSTEVGLEKFLSLLPRTNYRHRIKSHESRHYQSILKAGQEHGTVQIAWVQDGKQLLASNMYIFFGSTVTYLHGVSDYRFRHLMAPYLLQWEAIKKAYDLGFRYYDFGGLAPADHSRPSWEGFTTFKRGFRGQEIASPGTFDFIYQRSAYDLYTQMRSFNRSVRSTLRSITHLGWWQSKLLSAT